MKKQYSIFKLIITTTIHLLFWVSVYFFYNYFLGYGSQNTAYINRFSLFLIPLVAIVFSLLFNNHLMKYKQYYFIDSIFYDEYTCDKSNLWCDYHIPINFTSCSKYKYLAIFNDSPVQVFPSSRTGTFLKPL